MQAALTLQRRFGNAAVTELLAPARLAPDWALPLQRCGGAPCACAGSDDGVHESQPAVQREGPADAGVATAGVPPAEPLAVRLDELMTSILLQTQSNAEARAQVDELAPADSADRMAKEAALTAGRERLIALLEERIGLLDQEISSLDERIGSVKASVSPESTALGMELVRREHERMIHQQQLVPLHRWKTRTAIEDLDRRIAMVDALLARLPPACDPSSPAAELLMLSKAEMERSKEQLAQQLAAGAVEYKQFDARWGATRYGNSPECTDIGAAGCGPSSLAIVMNYLYLEDPESLAASGQFEIVTPKETAAYAAGHGRVCNNGTKGDVMITDVSTGFPGFRGQRITLDQATERLRDGNLVIFLCHGCTGATASGGNKSYGGHFMVLSGVDSSGKTFNVLDPGANETHDIETISRAQLKSHADGFWIVSPK